MTGKILSITLSLIMALSIITLCGCDGEKKSTTPTPPTTTSVQQHPFYMEIENAIKIIAKADKTNALEDELKKYPEYFINSDAGYGGLKEFKKCIKENFYSCDTEYAIYDIQDVTETYKKSIEKELKNDFQANIEIQSVAKVEDAYRYYNYDDNMHVDDSSLVPTTEYFIKFDNTWYYGWGLTLNSEVQEIEQ